MNVILLQDVYKTGVAGQVVKVADGFARNYLIPREMAVKATKAELRRTTKIREQVEARKAAYENQLNELARVIDGTELIFGRLAAVTGKLFGSVTTQEIADALMEKSGVDINRRRISQQALREVGTHDVPVRLGSEISPILKISIVRQEELADFLAARERGESGEEMLQVTEDADEAVEAVEEAAEETVEEIVSAVDLEETEVIPTAAVEEAMAMAEDDDAEETDESADA